MIYMYRLYFGENNIPGMFAVLQPLHAKMEKGSETLKEVSFNHVSKHYHIYIGIPGHIAL